MNPRFGQAASRAFKKRLFPNAAALLLALGSGAAMANPSPAPLTAPAARLLLEKYCYDCHGDGMDKGKVALDGLLDSARSDAARAGWLKAWKIMRHEFMPPAGEASPSEAERQALLEWIARERLDVNFEKPDPGRVTLRRLNRVEYEYTVQDLFGANLSSEQNYSSDGAGALLNLRDRLPPDDTAFGFDNIGDFQSVSPALLERYFDIAEYVVSRVVSLDGPRSPEKDLARPGIKVARSETGKRAEHSVAFDVEEPGAYRVDMQFTLGGWQEYGGAYDFVFRVNDAEAARERLDVGGYKLHRFSKELSLPAGTHRVSFSTDALKPDSKGQTNYLELKPKLRLTGPLGGIHDQYPEAHRRVFFKGNPPAGAPARREYAREILERVASRAFRRPADAETIDGLVELASRHDKFESGISQALTAILTSPKFLFRAETQPQPDDPKAVHPIDEYALASRLSYLLWLSLPDEELTRLAKEGKLRANLRAQVRRMLADGKSDRFFEDFPGQWLRTRNVLMAAINRDDLLDPVRAPMKRETEMLFEHIAREDRDLIELITADYTFLNKRLAEFYGLKAPEGDGFQKVALPPESQRGGILTHGSFLVATSNPNRTSPVKRGLFVLENLLATEPPPPPPDIPALDDVKADGATPKTVREQLAIHRENKSCASCHAHFDPIGIVLENFDVLGRWRDKENGEPIDPSAETVKGESLKSVSDLRRIFAARKEHFYRGAAEKLLTYALGRGLEPYDAVTVDEVARKVAEDNGKFSTLLFAVVESPAFQTRRGDSGEAKTMPSMKLPEPPPVEKRRPRPRQRIATNAVVSASAELPATNRPPSAVSNP